MNKNLAIKILEWYGMLFLCCLGSMILFMLGNSFKNSIQRGDIKIEQLKKGCDENTTSHRTMGDQSQSENSETLEKHNTK
jgi:hypothetical protein